MPEIYLDNAATTPLHPEVLKAMEPFFTEQYGNPQSIHQQGKKTHQAISKAKETIAKILNCKPHEIIFTSGGTESNNLATIGFARANKEKGNHIITSTIEHASIREPLKQLEKEGYKITEITVDQEGLVDLSELEHAITPQTILTTIIHGNNEIGTVQPINKITKICQKHNIPLHIDACQTAGYFQINTKDLTMTTINSSKVYGPKGIALLHIKDGTKIEPIIHGGRQQDNLRSGTQNTPAIVGFAKALEIAHQKSEHESARLTKLRDNFINEVISKIPDTKLNGHPTKRLPNNISFTFPGLLAEQILAALDEEEIYVSTGSACSAGRGNPSQTLRAIALPRGHLHSTIRITLGRTTTVDDLNYTLKVLQNIIAKLRK